MSDAKTKIQEALVDMAAKLAFDPEAHAYARKSDGKLMAGTTSVTALCDTKEWKAAWGAKMAVKELGYRDEEDGALDLTPCSEMLERLKSLDPAAFHALLAQAKGAAFRRSKEAKLDGQAGHRWVETWVSAAIEGAEKPALPEGPLNRALAQFTAWAEANVKEWMFSEGLIFDDEHEYGGTADAAAVMADGKLAMIDWKFATAVGADYFVQLAAYCHPFEKYGIKFDARLVVRLPKTETRQVYDRKTRKYSTVPNDIEVIVVPTDYEADRRAFFHARELLKWINYANPK